MGAAILKLKSSSFKWCIGSDFPGRETKRNTRLSDAGLKHSVTAGHFFIAGDKKMPEITAHGGRGL